MAQPLWKSLASPQTLLNIKVSLLDIAVPPLGVYSKEVKHVQCSYMDIHDRIIHNSQKSKSSPHVYQLKNK